MAYSTNPNLPKARATALRLLVEDQVPLVVVARKCGVHRSTVWRWKRKWEELNKDWQMDNPNRPNRVYSRANHLARCTWSIPTLSSRPHGHAWAIPEKIVQTILEVRSRLKRCAEVVWHHVTTVLGISVSLSSVRRILRRHHCFDGARKPRVGPDNPQRPWANSPGALVQIDTIHHVNPRSGRKLYYYTVIDLFTRMTYVTMSTQLRQGLAVQAILGAQETWRRAYDWTGTISMVQSDNGPEFKSYFAGQLKRAGISNRHSRLQRPNDNAHVERFNRTLQEECIGHYWRTSVPLARQREKLSRYIDFYNNERIHLGIQMRTPSEMLQR